MRESRVAAVLLLVVLGLVLVLVMVLLVSLLRMIMLLLLLLLTVLGVATGVLHHRVESLVHAPDASAARGRAVGGEVFALRVRKSGLRGWSESSC